MRTGREREAVVAARDELADGVIGLTLTAPDGGPLPSWRPGSHATLLLPNGLERQYSLVGDATGPGPWRIAVRLEEGGRGGSAWVHEHLAPGSAVSLRGPENHFALAKAPRYEFVAGGIGITPLLSMIAAVDAKGAPWRLAYAGRSRRAMPFLDELLERHPDRVTAYPADEGRRLRLRDRLDAPDEAGTLVYACGPEPMLAELADVMTGWPVDALHLERFAPLALTDPVWPGPFEVELLFTGATITVQPDETILDAAAAAGALVLSSCREGTCGTCETIVTEGTIDHRDSVLSPAERERGDRMMICVSRAACARLALEL